MKIMIFGSNEISFMIAHELYQNHDITVIDTCETVPEDFNKLDISYICGNGANAKVLEKAGIKTADVFIASTNMDEVNIISSWTAKNISNIETVCFVSRHEYLENVNYSTESIVQSQFGIDHLIWPEELLTQEILRIITEPEAIDVEIFAGGKAKLLEYKIKDDSKIVDQEVKYCSFPEDVLMIGLTKGDSLFIPDGSTRLGLGDKAIFMGTEKGLNILSREFFYKKKSVDTATIIGGGNVGYNLALKIEEIGIKTKLIESCYSRCEFLSDNLKKTLVLCADGTNLELLESENIGNCDVLVSVTNNDEKNLLCSLLAKQLGVKRVITRVNKPRNVSLFEKVGVDVAISPLDAALKEIRNKLIERDIDILAIVERGQGEVIEVNIPYDYKDREVKNITLPVKAVIGAIQRGSKILIPKGNTYIRANDNLLVFTSEKASNKIKEYFMK